MFLYIKVQNYVKQSNVFFSQLLIRTYPGTVLYYLSPNFLTMKGIFQNKMGRFSRSMKLLVFLVVGMLSLTFDAGATHFRYGNISWTVGTNDTIIFQVSQSWRRTFFGAPTVGNFINTGTFNFGDGGSQSLDIEVTSVNVTDDWFNGIATLKHKYVNNGTYTANWQLCCRISSLLNGNNDQNAINQSVVQVGNGNNSPISAVPPFINFNQNSLTNYQLPGFDPDNHTFTYSITPTAGSGLPTTFPPGLTLSPSGLISWTPTVNGLYAINITITDQLGATSVIDFIIRVGNFVSVAPTFNYAVTPSDNFVYSVQPGTPINFNVEANDTDPGSTVTLIASGLPSGVTFTPSLPTTANPVSTNFAFTPTNANIGTYVVSFTATDNNNLQTTTNVIISVNTNPVFDVPPTPPSGSEFCYLTGNSYTFPVQASNALSAVDVSLVSMTGLPAGATMSPSLPTTNAPVAMSTFSWSPVPSEWGYHTGVWTATDANAKSTTHTINFIVNTSPSITSGMPSGSAVIGSPYTHLFTGSDANVPYGDVLSFHAIGLPSWLTLTDNNDGTATLSGTPGAGDAGVYTFDIGLEDIYHHCGPHVEETVTITVSGCNLVVTANDIYSCPGVPITLNGSPAGGTWNLPNPYMGPSTTFTYYYMDGNGCTGSATANINVGQPVITNVSVSNITGISASVHYGGVNGIGWYELRWRPVGSTTWTVGTNSAMTTKLLIGLTPNSAYEVQVRGYCSTTLPPGAWTTANFNTNSLCDVPSGLFVSNLTAATAKLNWSPVAGVGYYSVRYRKLPGGSWTTGTTMVNFKTINGLTANSNYEFQVRSNCAASAGAWSPASPFTTASSKGAAQTERLYADEVSVLVYPNPTQGECNIEFTAENASLASIKVMDMSGRVVMEEQTLVDPGMNVASLNMSQLTNGLYTVQVIADEQLKAAVRVVKN
jgi:hypothetical protein